MTSTYERRYVATDFEVRTAGGKTTFEGYALTWDTKSQNLGGFRERVAEGATSKTIQEADIRALFNHDASLILGRNKSGTLELSNDSTGTYYRTTMPETTYARDLAVSMERGDITQSSFGFRTITDEWGIDEDDFPIRTLREIALFDVSPVTYPAYLDSSSGLGKRALARLAETRGIDLATLGSDEGIKAAIRGDVEPEPDEATTQNRSLLIPIYDLPTDPVAALRSLRSR